MALPLSARGIAAAGIELSPHMAEKLLAKPGSAQLCLEGSAGLAAEMGVPCEGQGIV